MPIISVRGNENNRWKRNEKKLKQNRIKYSTKGQDGGQKQ